MVLCCIQDRHLLPSPQHTLTRARTHTHTHTHTHTQDPRVERLPCSHKGTYADDCICERVAQAKCYIVATCDRDLRRRIRKVGARRGWVGRA
jgi:rRNA-processing protein FCF1